MHDGFEYLYGQMGNANLVTGMLSFQLMVSSKGFAHVPMNLHDSEFEFIVGGSKYTCSMIIAEFLSPKICSLRMADPAVHKYALQTKDPDGRFKDFLSLPCNPVFEVDSENFDFLVSVTRELENEEILSQLVSHYLSNTELTTSNAVQLLLMKGMCRGTNADDEIGFIARHFHSIDNLSSLEISYLRRVLSHPSLRIESEDRLYDFICCLIDEHDDPSFSELFEFVIFKFLSAPCIEHFCKTSCFYIFDYITLPFWKSLCDRLCANPFISSSSYEGQNLRYGRVIVEDKVASLEEQIHGLTEEIDGNLSHRQQLEAQIHGLVEQRDGQRRVFEREISSLRDQNERQKQRIAELTPPLSISYNGSNRFDGIIADLRRKCGGNPDRRGLMKVSASSVYCNEPHQILDYDWQDNFYTNNEPDSWIELDMKDHPVSLTYYALKAQVSSDHHFFKSWIIEGSNNHMTWTQLDERNTRDLCGRGNAAIYRVQNSGTFYRYIRMTQTGKNSSNRNHLLLTNIELFGQIKQ